MADVKRTHAVITVPDNGPELQSESHCRAILKDRLLFEFNTDVYENKGKYLGDILKFFEFLRENLKVKKKHWEFTETYSGDLFGTFVSRPSHALFHYIYTISCCTALFRYEKA